jgi:hypothetical protein
MPSDAEGTIPFEALMVGNLGKIISKTNKPYHDHPWVRSHFAMIWHAKHFSFEHAYQYIFENCGISVPILHQDVP